MGRCPFKTEWGCKGGIIPDAPHECWTAKAIWTSIPPLTTPIPTCIQPFMPSVDCRLAGWWKGKLEAYARRTGQTMTHIIVESVCKEWASEHLRPEPPTDQHIPPAPLYPPPSSLWRVNYQVPGWWKDRLKAESQRTGRTMTHIIIDSVRKQMGSEALVPELTSEARERRRLARLEGMRNRKSTSGPSRKRKSRTKKPMRGRIIGRNAGGRPLGSRPLGGRRR